MAQTRAILLRIRPSYHHIAYHALVQSLLGQYNFLGAVAVFGLMRRRGLIQKTELECQMMMLRLVSDPEVTEPDVLDAIRVCFDRCPGDYVLLHRLVSILVRTTSFSLDFFPSVFDMYWKVSGSDATVSVETANLVRHYIVRSLPLEHRPMPEWVKRMLPEMEKNLPDKYESFQRAMIKYPKSDPGVLLGNLFIQDRINVFRYDLAFSLFEDLRSSFGFVPNMYTYRVLFRAIAVLEAPRTLPTRKISRPDNWPSPRSLFRDMLNVHAEHHSPAHPVVTGPTLTEALTTFLKLRDYAAAYVTIRTYAHYGVLVTTDVYRLVFTHFVGRVEEEEAKETARRQARSVQAFYTGDSRSVVQEVGKTWTMRFLRNSESVPGTRLEIMQAMMSVGKRPKYLYRSRFMELEMDPEEERAAKEEEAAEIERPPRGTTPPQPIPDKTRKIRRHVVPLPVLLGLQDPARDTWDVVPLTRILKQAIIADMTSPDDLGAKDGDEKERRTMEPGLKFSLAVASAKEEMITSKERKDGKEKSEVKHEEEGQLDDDDPEPPHSQHTNDASS